MKLVVFYRLFFYKKTKDGHAILQEAYAIKGNFIEEANSWVLALNATLITGGHPRLITTGSWAKQSGLVVSHESMFERRKNLSGITIIDSVLPWPPITIVENDNQGELYQTGTKWDNCEKSPYILVMYCAR